MMHIIPFRWTVDEFMPELLNSIGMPKKFTKELNKEIELNPVLKEYIDWFNSMSVKELPKLTILRGQPGTGKTFIGTLKGFVFPTKITAGLPTPHRCADGAPSTTANFTENDDRLRTSRNDG